MQLAQICIEGMTWHLFKVLKESKPNLILEGLKLGQFDHYGDYHTRNPFSRLKTLLQDGSANGYVKEFQMLAAQILVMPEDQYMGLFL